MSPSSSPDSPSTGRVLQQRPEGGGHGAGVMVRHRNHAGQFLRNLFRKNQPPAALPPGNAMVHLAQADTPTGDPLMSEADLAVFVAAFEATGFSPSIHWYRNVDDNWRRLADVDPIVRHPALMVYGSQDPVAQAPYLTTFVPGVEVAELDCGHWIQQERPAETTAVILAWLARTDAARVVTAAASA